MTCAPTGNGALAAPLLAILLAACQGSDPQPLELLSLDGFGDHESLLDGGGASSIIGYTSSSDSPVPSVRLVRHDAATPGRLEPLGDVRFTGSGAITRLRIIADAAALIVDGGIRVVDLTDPSLPIQAIPVPGAAIDLAVSGRWVAVAVDHGLVLVHRDAPSTSYAYVASGTPTALLATTGGILAFTAAGYVVVDTSAPVPTFREEWDAALGGIRAVAATAGGSGAWVAGPGAAPGKARVLRLDLADPSAPRVVRTHELPGSYVAFAWDGGSSSVMAIHGEGDDARPESFHQGYLVRESSGGFTDTGVPLSFWSQSSQPLAAHSNHLFAAQAGGVALLRIR